MRKRKRLWNKTVAIAMIFLMIAAAFIQPVSAEGGNPPNEGSEVVGNESGNPLAEGNEPVDNEGGDPPAEGNEPVDNEGGDPPAEGNEPVDNEGGDPPAEGNEPVDAEGSNLPAEGSKPVVEEESNSLVESPELVSTNEVSPNALGKLTKEGKSIPEVTFSIYNQADEIWYDGVTDQDGNFGFTLPDGEYVLYGIWLGSESKWYPLDLSFRIQNGELVDPEILNLNLADKESNVKGSVKKDGQSVAGALMNARTADGSEKWYDATTDENGDYELYMPDGDYEIVGVWVALESKWYPLEVSVKVENRTVVNPERLTLDLTEKGPNVTGSVKKNGQGLVGALMNARTATGAEKWYDATTDENGNYELYMPNGEYEIVGVWVASESKWYPLEVSVTVQNGAAVTPEVLNLDLTEKGPNVTGSILKNGDPVAGALINARTATGAEKWYDATTDEDGNYKLYLPGGEYEIVGVWVASESKWYPLEVSVTVQNGEVAILDLDLTEKEPNVKGSVLKGGKPVASALMNAHTTKGEEKWYDATTDADGNYQLYMPDGDYEVIGVWVDSEQKWYPLNLTFSVVNGGLQGQEGQTELVIDLTAKQEGNIEGSIEGVNGGQIGIIDLNDPDPYTQYWVIDDSGQFSLELPDGDYMVAAINPNNTGTKLIPMQVSFSVQNGGLLLNGESQGSLSLQLPPVNFKGQLLQSGFPLPESDIYLSSELMDGHSFGFVVKTDDWDGLFSERLGDGSYTITGISTPLAYIEYHREFKVSDGDTSFDFTSFDISEGNNVKGEVRFSTGSVYRHGGSLEIVDANGDWYYVDANGEGEFSLLLPNGEYKIISFWSSYGGDVDLNPQTEFSVQNDLLVGESLIVTLPSNY